MELVSANSDIRNINFGTDEDPAIYNGFEEGLSSGGRRNGEHLMCFNHIKDSIKRKLSMLNLPKHASRQILDDIFGYVDDTTKFTDIVDAKSKVEFEMLVLNCQEKWDTLERRTTINNPPQLFNYFVQYKSQIILKKMLPSVRECGLGSPPLPCTQNALEAVNHVCKVETQHKKKTMAEINKDLKIITLSQRVESLKAIFESGNYRLSPLSGARTVSTG